jgi:hypothetical protein
MPDDNPPQNPPVKSFLETIKELYPDEFSNKPATLKQQLHNSDQIIAIEENYLDKPPQRKRRPNIDSIEEQVAEDYHEYRDSKKWLGEE